MPSPTPTPTPTPPTSAPAPLHHHHPPPNTTAHTGMNTSTSASNSNSTTTSQRKPVTEPSRFIHVSGVRQPQPLTSLRHWFSRGHYVYDELRAPVVPTAVAGAGPDRLATATSGWHPRWEDTLEEEEGEEEGKEGEEEGEEDGGEVGGGGAAAPLRSACGGTADGGGETTSGGGGEEEEDGASGCGSGSVVGVVVAAAADGPATGGVAFEAQMKLVEDVEAAFRLQTGEDAVAAEEEEREKAEIRRKTWSGSRGKYGHPKSAYKPHAPHGRPVGGSVNNGAGTDGAHHHHHQKQQQQRQQGPQQDAMAMSYEGHGANPYAGADAGYPGQFHPFPTPIAHPYQDHMATASAYQNGSLESPRTHFMRVEYEAKLEAAKQAQYRRRCERLAERPWTWMNTVRDTTPVVSPVVSTLSPRATEFVPAGLISPHTNPAAFMAPPVSTVGAHHHPSQTPGNVCWYPAPPTAVGTPQYWQLRQYQMTSTFNPAVGEFRPRAMPPRGPNMDG
ncbi:uncharacterized protein BKCO1_2000200 [Diplodia corticola]|uniref:Uncharacterized protein n=1 Tax=Diplodia corticola TaxID=236234 RepID=A0A1J9RGZ6_9PEZI|nr:uncharacterized protein BKCO1_2000200 [Diplodia corticola]OJD39872.1 hypothetical protein BKCO1_2000200 [Diplodia corticola]